MLPARTSRRFSLRTTPSFCPRTRHRPSRVAAIVPAANVFPLERGARRRFIAVAAVLVCAVSLLGSAVADAAAAAPAATLRDPANDVRAGDIDLTSISVSKQSGALVVRFTVRRPITDNVSYTASVGAGAGSWALVARRSARSRLVRSLQPLDRDDHDDQRDDRRPHRDGQGSNRRTGRADQRRAGPAQRLLPSRAGRRPKRRRRPCRDDGADDLVLPHGPPSKAEMGSLHLARPGPLSVAASTLYRRAHKETTGCGERVERIPSIGSRAVPRWNSASTSH